MSGFEMELVKYILNSLWQAPLVFAAAWIAARGLRPAGPAAEHRVWVVALMLESVLPALSLFSWGNLRFAWPWFTQGGVSADGNVAVRVGAGSTGVGMKTAVMGAVAFVYAAVTAYFVARFVWRWVRLPRLRRGAEPLRLSNQAALMKRFEIGTPIAIMSSTEIFAPVTLGIVNACVLLPAAMLTRMSQTELDTALAHELAHIRRNDFLKNLVYEIVALPMSYHPFVWFTRQQMMETREMACDEMAAVAAGSERYAQSLLRLAALLLQGRPLQVPHAIGIFDANTLERRLMRLTEKRKQMSKVRARLAMVVCVMLGVATAASAVALRVGVDPKTGADEHAKAGAPHTVPAKIMQGNVISKVTPRYPPAAKTARIQGTVELDAVIDKSGRVDSLKVKSGPSELQQSSLDAVRQWRYKPFLLNGNPIQVETTISVVYSLQN